MTDLQLQSFNEEEEALEYFTKNLKAEIKHTELQLKELCRLLGNLPLAMQLTGAVLNAGKIDLENYTENLLAENIENTVDAEFENHEKIIKASLKIILNVLEKEEKGIVAKDILTIFGYIRPDDVILDFFEESLKLGTEDVKNAIELLIKYSLISVTKELTTFVGEKKLLVSITHPLLQQVLRYNSKENEEEITLRKILGCNGNDEYKFVPFTKFADDDLQKEFIEVKAVLLDPRQLTKSVNLERFKESVELSRFIDKHFKFPTTKFNYAMCLQMNGQLQDSITVLEELYTQEIKEDVDCYYYCAEIGLLGWDEDVSKKVVGGHLLISHSKMDNKERLQEILEERKSFKMIHSQVLMNTLFRILDDSNLIQSNYTLKNYGSMFHIVLGGDLLKKTLELEHCPVDLSISLPKDLHELVSTGSQFINANAKGEDMTDISEWLPKKKLDRLEICGSTQNPILLFLTSISSVENLSLSNDCVLNLDSEDRISPRQLKLSDVYFIRNEDILENVNINDFIDFHNMNRLELSCIDNMKMSIDLSEESTDIEYILLENVTAVSLKSANNDNNARVKEAEIRKCLLDLSTLPASLEKLSLDTKIFTSGEIELPNLKYLQVEGISDLSHFRSLQFTHLHLKRMQEVTLQILPTTTKIIRIDSGDIRTTLMGEVISLDKLILKDFPLTEVEEMLPHFQNIKQLTLFSKKYQPTEDLIQLMDKQEMTIAIGNIEWGEEDFQNSPISKQVDQQSPYYLFQEGTGKAIEQKDFEELFLLKDV